MRLLICLSMSDALSKRLCHASRQAVSRQRENGECDSKMGVGVFTRQAFKPLMRESLGFGGDKSDRLLPTG